MTQSSVEWLEEKIKSRLPDVYRHMKISSEFEQAKAMHKEEIEKAWNERIVFGSPYKTAKDYYNGTFGKSEQ